MVIQWPSGIEVRTSLSKGGGIFSDLIGENLRTESLGNEYQYIRLTGDFNGDGKTDLAWSRTADNGITLIIALSRGYGAFDPAKKEQILFSGINMGTTNQYTSIPCDLNGDGITDMAWSYSGVVKNSVSSFLYSYTAAYTALGNGDGTFQPAAASTPYNNGSLQSLDQYSRLAGDFNGDGRADLAWSYSGLDGIIVITALGKGDGTFEAAQQGVLYTGQVGEIGDYSRLTGDFNGDGKTDLAWSYTGPSGIYVLTAIGKGDGTFEQAKGAVPDLARLPSLVA